MNQNILEAAKQLGILTIVCVPPQPGPRTLAEACAARGLNPASYKTPQQKFLAVDRLIPGRPDRESPNLKKRGAVVYGNGRKMYFPQAAQAHALRIASAPNPVAEYVALFCELNHLT